MNVPIAPFDERDTISVPTSESVILHPRSGPVVAARNLVTGEEMDLPLSAGLLIVGAGAGADILLEDRYVSAIHCQLERHGEMLTVRDRQSRNGTFLNGNRVQVAELRPGTLLTCGKTTLVLLGERGRDRLTAFEQLRGESPAFRRAVRTAIKAASSDCSVLIVGETGTGKELVARAIHEASARSIEPFVALNCGAIPRELIGSELFGHIAGAYTGAKQDRDGVFVRADKGSLFLDELGELPLEQQPHLLRVLETRMVCPVGSNQDQQVDVRVIAATNADVYEPATLRKDLFHRLATVVVEIPPLRERQTDIPLLVRAFMADLAPRFGRRAISPKTMHALMRHDWPGNVRELRHAVERAMTLCSSELSIDVLLQRGPEERERDDPEPPSERKNERKPRTELGAMEGMVRDLMAEAYRIHGNARDAAASLGMPKSTFCDRARRYGIALDARRRKREGRG